MASSMGDEGEGLYEEPQYHQEDNAEGDTFFAWAIPDPVSHNTGVLSG